VSEMALRLEDIQPGIAPLARRFFFNLSKKGNAIYNILPDVLSNLSQDESVSSESFQEIMKFLISFIQKDRQNEALVDKLCQRFRVSKSMEQYRDIGFCLALLTYNDKAIKKLKDHFALYKDHMHDEALFNHFQTITQKAKREKAFGGDMKAAIEDLESTILSLFRGENGKLQNLPSKPKATSAKRPAHRKKKKVGYASSDEEDDSLSLSDEDANEVEEAVAPTKPKFQTPAPEDEGEELQEAEEEAKPKKGAAKRGAAKGKKSLPKAAKKGAPKRGRALRQKNDSSSLSEESGDDSSPVRKIPAKLAAKRGSGKKQPVEGSSSLSPSQEVSSLDVPQQRTSGRRAPTKRN